MSVKAAQRMSAEETHFRYMFGPKLKIDEEAYNSYFDATSCDLSVSKH